MEMGIKRKWWWTTVILILMISFHANACLVEERTALLHLKAILNHPNSISGSQLFDSWKEDKTSDCCDGWSGVRCGTNGRVISLAFRGLNIQELHFNASILLPFQELRKLDLSWNSISTWTEAKGSMKLASKLTKLELLDLSYNELDSSILRRLRGFQSLRSLRLANTFRWPGGLAQIDDISSISKNLKELDLSGTGIAGFRTHHNGSMKLSSSLPSLEELDLSRNDLNNSILPYLRGFQSLTGLLLSSNKFSGQIELNDLDAISRNLQMVDLSGNSITNFGRPNGCGQMLKLRILYLGSNQLETLPSCMSRLTSLQEVDLSDNGFSGILPSWMANWTHVRMLDLARNQFKGNIASSPLVHMRSLEQLTLSENHFEIPHSFRPFAKHTKLKYFEGQSNRVILDHSDSFIPGFQLQELALSNCGVNATLPSFLHHQHDLRFVDLSSNSLQGNFPTWLLENNPNMEQLHLRNNSFIGVLQLPSSIHVHLHIIDISQNMVEGRIPRDIGAILPQLEIVDMSYNKFTGNISSTLCDMKSLSQLDLSNNHLSGRLEHLGRGCFKSLGLLSLSNNHFEGDLPSLYDLQSLLILDVEGNNLSGTIKANTFNRSLEILNLGNNFLKGSIPEDFCSLYSLIVLDLSHNMLNGSLPTCLNSSSLTFLYLNDNNFTGGMTDASYDTPVLEILDLSNNDLTGPVPAWIGNLTSLSALLLRGNRIHGRISLQLCELVGLSILDVSYNNLTGHIPPCLANIAFSIPNASSLIPEFLYGIYHPTFTFEEHVDFTTKSMTYKYSGRILNYMKGIDLSCNKLTGNIPVELGNLSNLHAMNLSHNNLWGAIPAAFSNLKQLESLDLSYNSLNGSIPFQLTELNSLGAFSVVHNNLSGDIPYQGHSQTFDASSYLGNPFLCGPPLSKSCTTSIYSATTNEFKDEEVEDDGWLEMDTFYISFGASSVTMFLGVLIALWINPHWLRVWFYLVKIFVLSINNFVEDIIRKFRRV